MNEREQLCKEFTELTGGHWHKCRWDNTVNVYKCLECELTSGTPIQNNKYTNPADILKVMMESKYCDDFLYVISCGAYIDPSYHCIGIEYIVEEDKLLKTAVEFLVKRSK
jgi:hypothetical protein